MATVIPADPERAASADQPDHVGVSARRVRHPASLIRSLTGLAVLGLVLLAAMYAQGTTGGLDADLTQGAGLLPWPPVKLAGALCAAALLLLPLAFAVDRLIRGERRRVADGVLAAVAAYGLSLGLDQLVGGLDALTYFLPGGHGRTDPVYGHLAPVLAFMTALGTDGLPRWRTALAGVLAAAGLSGLITGYATPISVLLALLLGWATAHGIGYLIGEPVDTPTDRQILHALAQCGVRPEGIRRTGPFTYLVDQADDGPELDVRLLDRRTQASGLLPRLWEALRLRTAPRPLGLRSLREGLEHQALLAYAATAAGARTQEPVAVAELGPGAAVVAYRALDAEPLDRLPADVLTDAVLADAWRQLNLLQQRRIAHRALAPDTVRVAPDGAVHLVDLADGEIAAGDLLLRLDVAGLLTALALAVGPERAVASGRAVLGSGAVAAALPLLQPIALPRTTRLALRERPKLVAEVRAELLRHLPQAPTEPVRLERLRPRLLLTVVASVLAGYVLLDQLFNGEINPFEAVAQADPLWLTGALLAGAASYPAATLAVIGFVPERVPFHRALTVQVAGSFVKLVSPGGLGGMALNTRFLQCTGIPTAQALSSVGASQLAGLVLHLLQLAAFGALVGVGEPTELPDPLVVATGVAAVAAAILATVAVPALRRRVQLMLRPLRVEVLPRLFDLIQQPGKLALGLAGQILVSLTYVVCLYCCTRALDLHPDFAPVGVANLVGNAVGNALPTPGGAGGVEGATIALLNTVAGMSYGEATATVVVYRLLVFLLPVLPGWAAFSWLQRRKAI